jgi:hypothetical protein
MQTMQTTMPPLMAPRPTMRASVEAIAQSLHNAFLAHDAVPPPFILWLFRHDTAAPEPLPDDGAWCSNRDADRTALIAATRDWIANGVPKRTCTAEALLEKRGAAEAMGGTLDEVCPTGAFFVLLFLHEVPGTAAAYLPAWYISNAPPEERETLVKPRLLAWAAGEEARPVPRELVLDLE